MKRLLYDLKWRRFHPMAFAKYAECQMREQMPLPQLREEQERSRKRIVAFAIRNTAFYRKLYGEAGFELGDMEYDGWFEKLPVVTKEDLREHFDEFVNPKLCQYLKVSTTGFFSDEVDADMSLKALLIWALRHGQTYIS